MKSDLQLTAAQLGVWYALKAGASVLAYNFADYTKILGAIDPVLFETALRRVVMESEALCVWFVERDDVPSQRIVTSLDWSMTYQDISSEANPISAAEAWMHADIARPIDPCHGPFFTFALFKAASEEFLWYARYHHLVMDHFGASLIAHRVASVYSALNAESHVDCSPFSSLAALVEEDAAYRASTHFESDRQFWFDSMSCCPEPLSLSNRTPPVSMQFLRQTIDIPSATVVQLQRFAQRMQLTFPQAVTAATAIFIHRLTEAEDLVLGQFLAARMTAMTLQTPAMVANVVPLRLAIQPATSVGTLVAQVRGKTRAGLLHQRYRIADLRRDLHRIAKPIFGPSINVMPFEDDLQFAGHHGITCGISNGPVDDLDVHVVYDQSKRGTYRVDFNANPALYDAEFLERLKRRFLQLLVAIEDPKELIGRLDILPLDERRQILVAWNQTSSDYPRGRHVHELFEEQAQRTPDHVAVVCGQQRLTYQELNEQADRIADHLSLMGVGPDERVGLYVERSLGMVVGLLGILKAGGAYVPLDPNYPQDRLAFILDDAQPLVLLSQQSLRDGLRPKNADIFCLDALLMHSASAERARSENKRRSSDLAYVIYTSGSTGQPKGVQISHQALVNFLKAMEHEPGIAEEDRLLSVTSLAFDIAGLELFLPLIVGAQVTIAPSDVGADGSRLASLMKECGATIMQATPATWRLLLEAGWEGSQHLKILCGGEAWTSELARALLPRCASLWNMYGPTETTVWSSVARIEANQRVLLGPPIDNTKFYVLDRYSQPVPIGVPGELYIGGDGVARGYLNRPELTRERFVADPFSNEPGARMYKTGDRVCHLPDGRLEFLCRLDHQVKIRGYRIELGEIESVLRLHSEVQDAVVVARDAGEGNARLIAYVTASGPEPVPVGGLRNLLRQKLPTYMMPSALVPLDAFPLTPNGKVDRDALPLPDEMLRDAREAYVAPRTPLEELLAGFWGNLLQLKQVSIHDNFFDLGGNSLLMLRLSRKIEQATGQSLPLTVIYDAPTVAGMAEILGGQKSGSSFSSLVLLRPGTEAPPVFIVHNVAGNAMEVIPIAKLIRGGHPIYGIQAKGLDGTDAPNDRVEAMANYYLSAITELQPRGPYFLAGLCFGGLVAVEIARRALERGDRIGLLALLDTYPDQRYWALRTRLNILVIRRLKKTWSELNDAASWREIVQNIMRRLRLLFSEGLQPWQTDRSLPPAIRVVLEGGIAALANYRPRYYPGKANYLKCEINDRVVPDDPIPVWGKLVRELDVQSVPGDHTQMCSTYAGDVAKWLSFWIQDATVNVSADHASGTPPARERAKISLVL
jgi:amino acid adenylation domain-containing protein